MYLVGLGIKRRLAKERHFIRGGCFGLSREYSGNALHISGVVIEGGGATEGDLRKSLPREGVARRGSEA